MFFVEKQTFAPKKFTYSIITFTKIDEQTAAAPLKGNSNNQGYILCKILWPGGGGTKNGAGEKK